jgi:hypothetical protein
MRGRIGSDGNAAQFLLLDQRAPALLWAIVAVSMCVMFQIQPARP